MYKGIYQTMNAECGSHKHHIGADQPHHLLVKLGAGEEQIQQLPICHIKLLTTKLNNLTFQPGPNSHTLLAQTEKMLYIPLLSPKARLAVRVRSQPYPE